LTRPFNDIVLIERVKEATPPTVDGYLARLSDEQRAALERLRRTIRAIVPRGEECISYQLPAFRLDGKVLVWFGAPSGFSRTIRSPPRSSESW
jgi:hypothetical protein